MQAEMITAVTEKPTTKIDYNQLYSDSEAFGKGVKVAEYLSRSTFIPKEFQNKPADCLIALHMAQMLQVTPFEVMRGIYVVHGKPSFTAQFAISLANTRGPFKSHIAYRTKGQGEFLEVTAFATHRDTNEEVSATVSMQQIQHADWGRKNANYKAIPEQMLSYRAAILLIRKTCPEILMGMQESNEAVDSQPLRAKSSKVEAILEQAEAVNAG